MILICGGAGYIGSHMVHCLRKRGIEHLVLDNFSKGHLKAIAGSPYVQADLRDRDAILRLFESVPIEAVMHFAASSEVGESFSRPQEYFENNVVATQNLLDAMVGANVLKMVFSSTAAVYGESGVQPIRETQPPNPSSPYGKTKLAAEQLLAKHDMTHGLKSVSLRYFNACGADPSGELGEDHRPESHLIPTAAFAALGRIRDLGIFGTDFDTADGTAVRDYVHVSDLVSAHDLALAHLQERGESRTYNLGHGRGFSVREVLAAVESVHGAPIEVRIAPRRAGDAACLIADSTAIRSELGWTPRFNEIETMVRHAYDWFVANPDGYGRSDVK